LLKFVFTTSFLYKLFLKLFNQKTFYYKLVKKRFLIKKFIKNYLLFNKEIFFNFFKLMFNSKFYFNTNKLIELNLVFLYFRNNYKTYRYLLGYPYTSHTHSNANIAKRKALIFKNIIIKYVFYRLLKKFTNTDKLKFIFIEFFNKLWFFQWKKEWKSAKLVLLNAMESKYSKWRFSYWLLTYNRPLTFYKTFSKIKSNKKKKIEFKNLYNIGFNLGFLMRNKEKIKRFSKIPSKSKSHKLKKLKKKK